MQQLQLFIGLNHFVNRLFEKIEICWFRDLLLCGQLDFNMVNVLFQNWFPLFLSKL